LIPFICKLRIEFSAMFLPHCSNVQEKEGRGRGVRIRRTKRWAKYRVNPSESGLIGEVIRIREAKDSPKRQKKLKQK
jgi:hypothetical protein